MHRQRNRKWITLLFVFLFGTLGCDGITGSWKVDVEEKEGGGGKVEVTPIEPAPEPEPEPEPQPEPQPTSDFELIMRWVPSKQVGDNKNDSNYEDKLDYKAAGYKIGYQIWTNWNFHFPQYRSTTPQYGGVPMEIDWADHFATMERTFDTQCPDKDYDGYCVIDFERYTPMLKYANETYRNAAIEWVRKKMPNANEEQLLVMADKIWLDSTVDMMTKTLEKAKQLRPKGKWGYYGYPHRCYYSAGKAGYSAEFKEYNDKYTKLWNMSDAIYPSIYIVERYESTTPEKLEFNKTWLKENVEEGMRIANGKPVLCFVAYCYYPGGAMMPLVDYRLQLSEAKQYGANGVILWMHSYADSTLNSLGTWFNEVVIPAHKSLGLIQ